jgi:hypothetical protein
VGRTLCREVLQPASISFRSAVNNRLKMAYELLGQKGSVWPLEKSNSHVALRWKSEKEKRKQKEQ